MQTDYIEYMTGHTISTYPDIQMKGTARAISERSIRCIRAVYKAQDEA